MTLLERENVIKGKTWQALVNHFENLHSDSLRSLKYKLKYCEAPEDCKNIPWSKLQKVRCGKKLADFFIRHYTIEKAGGFAVKLLADINEKQMSKELEAALKKENCNSSTIDLYCYESLFNYKRVGNRNIKCCGSPRRRLVGGTLATQQITGHISNAVIETKTTNVNCTQEINAGPVLQETFDSTGPSTDSPIISKEETDDIPVDHKSRSPKFIEHKNQQHRNNGKSIPVTHKGKNGPVTNHIKKSNAKRILRRGKPLQDLVLPALDKCKHALIKKHSNGKIRIYVKLLFQHFVQFETYEIWTKKTNFNGYGGKNAIPKNLSHAIQKEVQKGFQWGKKNDGEIRKEINRLLSNPITSGWADLM
ncbi:uncharacterized protein LOC121398223 [Xenopus laevis]|uniref:Uncharacterized protein LOC121398223 n=1 Tax=Xenopus laevis TaxID=8355 RepID=A0A8J1LUL4_XENLA|nr:uncharacterized protein LOC121398223 [Xenopus laevis]OCT59066.1 hypothetical protein XELAEV_18001554mg [Xenopus laevis]